MTAIPRLCISKMCNICHLLHTLNIVTCICHGDLPDEAHTNCCIRVLPACLQNHASSIVVNADVVLNIDR